MLELSIWRTWTVLAFLVVAVPGCSREEMQSDSPIPAANSAHWVPESAGWVTDLADVLTAEQSQALAGSLERFRADTGHQIAVLTIERVEEESIETFARRVGNAWGVGRPEFQDGVLVVLATDDRETRIEIADGLRDRIPDALAAEILQQDMIPEFKERRYEAGLRAGVESLMQAARQPLVLEEPIYER